MEIRRLRGATQRLGKEQVFLHRMHPAGGVLYQLVLKQGVQLARIGKAQAPAARVHERQQAAAEGGVQVEHQVPGLGVELTPQPAEHP